VKYSYGASCLNVHLAAVTTSGDNLYIAHLSTKSNLHFLYSSVTRLTFRIFWTWEASLLPS